MKITKQDYERLQELAMEIDEIRERSELGKITLEATNNFNHRGITITTMEKHDKQRFCGGSKTFDVKLYENCTTGSHEYQWSYDEFTKAYEK